MPDPVAPPAPAPTTSALPTPADVVASLTAAKSVSGMAFRQEAERLQGLAAALPAADKQLLDSIRRSVGTNAVDDAMRHGGLSPSDARNQALGDRLIAAGRTLAETREVLNDPKFEPDNRSAAQREHDSEHSIAPVVDQASYYVPKPPSETAASWAPVAVDARSFAADLGFAPAQGSDFIRTIVAAVGELAQSADPGMVKQRWHENLAVAFGDKLSEAEARVDAMLKARAGTSKMAAKLRERGLLRHPEMFVRLHNRALSLAHWAATRPA